MSESRSAFILDVLLHLADHLLMKKLILLIGLSISAIVYSQNLSDYQNIVSELSNPENSLNIELRVPNSDFYIVIRNHLSSPRKYYGSVEPCLELKSNLVSNKKIQEVLSKNNLLENLYVAYDDTLTKLTPGDVDRNTLFLWISIIYATENNSRIIAIPISEKSVSKKFINDFQEIFPNESCFSKLESKLKP